MKPTKLVIRGIGKIANEAIVIDKPLLIFFGEIQQGKSTILNCVRWVCGGEFPEDIIRHGEKEGLIELHFDGGMIARSFYRAKDGSAKARPVQFIKNGRPVSSPVAEIKRFLNPFLLDQDFLRNKTELERKQYFTELFAVDTTDLDTEAFNIQRDAQALRAKIAGYGEIDLTKVGTIDTAALKRELSEIRSQWANKRRAIEAEMETVRNEAARFMGEVNRENAAIETNNNSFDSYTQDMADNDAEIANLQRKIDALRFENTKINDWLKLHPKRALQPAPNAPDMAPYYQRIRDGEPNTSELEAEIQNAAAQNVRAEQYAASLKRQAAKEHDETLLRGHEARLREIKLEKQAKLKSIGDTCGIKGLSFDETGNFIYDGTTAGMISDSQIMRLSSELSALYPKGFCLDLIDRAESLGKSIFTFVERAKAENKSILATIVGEKPATVPADVGVFVVEDGKLL